jgi:hypothetical protein
MAALRAELRLPGRVLHFVTSNLAAAFDAIRSHQPGLVVIDGEFAETLAGRGFIDRVDKLSIAGSQTQLVKRVKGAWATTPLASSAAGAAPATAPKSPKSPKSEVKAVGLSTRRAPRFLVIDPLQAAVESSKANLVDLSVLGAQVVSTPALRPNQMIKIALPDEDETLLATAHVVWAYFEKPAGAQDPQYRVGLEFTQAASEALEDYCHRHCAEEPLPLRNYH